ncbi:MAG: SirB2 family protein [Aliivibrio sp.]|uniref:SirB2 family protein n=1 Tax=Aliivibrio sp. TaxID=1872443 RepID=UPI001A3A80E9|nr:SirB2 family protein [Aliivibrio sp.]
MYAAIKHIHMLTIVLSVGLFIFRYILLMSKSSLLEKKFLKVAPHVIDTLLLGTGVVLIFLTGFYPFTPAGLWLTEKLTCVFAYIALGYVALHLGESRVFKGFAFFGALGWILMAAKLAVTKVPSFLG